jgi:hypothetical protein
MLMPMPMQVSIFSQSNGYSVWERFKLTFKSPNGENSSYLRQNCRWRNLNDQFPIRLGKKPKEFLNSVLIQRKIALSFNRTSSLAFIS